MFSVKHLELNGARLSLCSNLFEPAASPCVAGLLHTGLERIRKKSECIEQGAFPHAVFADYRCHGSERLLLSTIP